MHTFTRDGFGRIYLASMADADKVRAIIKERFFDKAYLRLPKEAFAPISDFPQVVSMRGFTAFDLDLLSVTCFARGIFIFCFDAGRQETPSYPALCAVA